MLEWWARFGGWLLGASLFWAAAGFIVIVIVGQVLLLESPKLMASAGGVSSLLAVLLRKSSLTPSMSKSGPQKPQNLLSAFGMSTLALAALLFRAIFLAFLSWLTSAVLPMLVSFLPAAPSACWNFLAVKPLVPSANCGSGAPFSVDTGVFPNPDIHLATVCQAQPGLIAMAMLALSGIMLVAGFHINFNKFSLHGD